MTKLLGRVCDQWGYDRQGLERDWLRLLFANLFMVVETATRPFQLRDQQDDFDLLPEAQPSVEERRRLWLEHLRRERAEVMYTLTHGPKGRSPDQLRVDWRLARERAVYKAITSCPALAAWIGGLEPDHMPRLIECIEDWYEPDMAG